MVDTPVIHKRIQMAEYPREYRKACPEPYSRGAKSDRFLGDLDSNLFRTLQKPGSVAPIADEWAFASD